MWQICLDTSRKVGCVPRVAGCNEHCAAEQGVVLNVRASSQLRACAIHFAFDKLKYVLFSLCFAVLPNFDDDFSINRSINERSHWRQTILLNYRLRYRASTRLSRPTNVQYITFNECVYVILGTKAHVCKQNLSLTCTDAIV